MSPFERLDLFGAALQRAASIEAVRSLVDREILVFGFERFAYTQQRTAGGLAGTLYFGTYPQDWSQHYDAHGLHLHDPAWREPSTTVAPFLWSEIGGRVASRAARRLVDGPAADAGLRAGGGIPLHGPAGMVASLQVSNDCRPEAFRSLFNAQRHLLQLVALQTHARVLALTGAHPAVQVVRLSPRQQQVLRLVIQGKSNADIGELLEIKEDTVRQHFMKVCGLLGVNTRTQAAVMAMTRILITP